MIIQGLPGTLSYPQKAKVSYGPTLPAKGSTDGELFIETDYSSLFWNDKLKTWTLIPTAAVVITGLTPNLVTFGSATGALQQDAKLSWNNSTSTLTIGTSPNHVTIVNGAIDAANLITAEGFVVDGDDIVYTGTNAAIKVEYVTFTLDLDYNDDDAALEHFYVKRHGSTTLFDLTGLGDLTLTRHLIVGGDFTIGNVKYSFPTSGLAAGYVLSLTAFDSAPTPDEGTLTWTNYVGDVATLTKLTWDSSGVEVERDSTVNLSVLSNKSSCYLRLEAGYDGISSYGELFVEFSLNSDQLWRYGAKTSTGDKDLFIYNLYSSLPTDTEPEALTILYANNRIGMGTTSPDARLDIQSINEAQLRLTFTNGVTYTELKSETGADFVITIAGGSSGTADVRIVPASGSGNSRLYLDGSAGTQRAIIGRTGTALRWLMNLGNTTAESGSSVGSDFQLIGYSDAGADSQALFIKRSTLFVGLGTTAPATNLDVRGTGTTSGSLFFNLLAYDTNTSALGVGGGIMFGGRYNSGGSLNYFAGIQGIKENATDGNYASALTFHTRADSGSLTEKLRIASDGKVGINTTAPGARLDVLSTTEVLRLSYDSSNYVSFTVSSAGDLTLNCGGDDLTLEGRLVVEQSTGPQLSLNYNGSNYITFSVSSSGDTIVEQIGDSLKVRCSYSGTAATIAEFLNDGGQSTSILIVGDGGSSRRGGLWVRRRSSTNMAAIIALDDESGTPHYLWFDTTGDLRTDTTDPTTTDTAGTVVGTQS